MSTSLPREASIADRGARDADGPDVDEPDLATSGDGPEERAFRLSSGLLPTC